MTGGQEIPYVLISLTAPIPGRLLGTWIYIRFFIAAALAARAGGGWWFRI